MSKKANWWIYKDFTAEEKQKVNDELQPGTKKIYLTKDFYDNMFQATKAIGTPFHPKFKVKPNYEKKQDLIDPEIGFTLGAPGDTESEHDEEEEDENQESAEKEKKEKEKKHKRSPSRMSQDSNLSASKQKDDQITFLNIVNCKVDYATLASIFYCANIEACHMNTLKLMRNNLSADDTQTLFKFLSKKSNYCDFFNFIANSYSRVFFDWQEIPKSVSPYFEKLGKSSTIEYLSLRGCNMDDDDFTTLCKGLSDISSSVKYLDVSENKIGKKGIEALVNELGKDNKVLQYIGLAQNGMTRFEQIQPLFDYIGKRKLEENEVEDYNKLRTEIQRVETVNKKLYAARKPTQPIPMQDPIGFKDEVDGDSKRKVYFLLQGKHIKEINLAFNRFDEDFKKPLQNFLLNQIFDGQVVDLSYNAFKAKSKKQMKNKYRNKILIDI